MAKEPMETIRGVLLIMMAVSKTGLEPEPLLMAGGLDITKLQNMEARVPARTVMRLWEEAVRLTGRDDIGLIAGQGYIRDPSDVVSEFLYNSITMKEGMYASEKFFSLVSEGHCLSRMEIGGKTRITMTTDPSLPQMHKPTTEGLLSVAAKVLLSISGGKPIFESVSFRHDHTGDTNAYVEHFKAPVRFDQDRTALTLLPGVEELPNPTANPEIVEILERYAADRTAVLQPNDQFVEDVRSVIAKMLRSEGLFGKEQIARRLGVSSRTLLRRLTETGTTFQNLLEQVRREISIECLENPKFTIQDTAFMAGYGGQGAFSRAFVRWFGIPPAQYRRGLTATASG